MSTLPTPPTAQPGRRRWPLLVIGASAGTATWSGWVGLGQLTGFGVVRPLPGIADAITINTAVTLPIGVEAYAMYALSVATSHRPMSDRTRRYAWASAGAALVLGMAGQVAYHVITAHHSGTTTPGLAPAWIIALVSCLPVVVLGAASLLWHLAGSTEEPDPPVGRLPLPLPHWWIAPEPSPSTEPAPTDRPAAGTSQAPERSTPGRPTAAPRSRPAVTARPEDIARVQAAIESGELATPPSAKRIRAMLSISPAYARAARDAVSDQLAEPPQESTSKAHLPKPDRRQEHEARAPFKNPDQQEPSSHDEYAAVSPSTAPEKSLENAEKIYTPMQLG